MLSLLVAMMALSARTAPPPPPPPPAPSPPVPCRGSSQFIVPLCHGVNLDRFTEEAKRALRRYDEKGDGLDAEDIELKRLRRQARERAESVKDILRYDLDGDFDLDRAEIVRAVPSDFWTNDGRWASNADQRLRQLFSTYDTDGDERIERDEIFHAPLPQANLYLLEGLRATLARDPGADGHMVEAELAQVAKQLFAAADANSDGIVTIAELEAQEERSKPRPAKTPSSKRAAVTTDICANGGTAPLPPDLGTGRVQAQYSFVTQGARRADLGKFLTVVSEAGFSFVPITINLNGADTMIVPGRSALSSAAEAEREFRAACALRTGARIYLVHAHYNPTTDQRGAVRVR